MITQRAERLPATYDRIHAKAKGYSFSLQEDVWTLDKNVTINVHQTANLLSGEARDGFLRALGYFAAELTGYHSQNILMRFRHMLRTTGASEISDTMLFNYRGSLSADTQWYLTVIRGFLRRWYKLGYPGISQDVIRLLDGWRLKGNRKGDAVKRKDPNAGPLTDNELQAFNEGVVNAFERDLISMSELAMCLVTSNTGRRPIQISHLRCIDVLRTQNAKGEPIYLLNVPRGKQGDGFRASFKPFAMSEELWAILSAQSHQVIRQVQESLSFELADVDREQIPLFPDMDEVVSVDSIGDFRGLLNTDKLHITAAEVTDILQFVVGIADVKSERTGEQLSVNARRFRYTTGTRAAREGFGELVIAELLDHSDTQNAGVYVKNIPEHVKRLDESVGFQLAPYAQAFAGVLVDSEKEARRGGDSESRIRTETGAGIGTCGEHGFCGANVPVPCYTCMHFQPWLNGPHKEVHQHLLNERQRLVDVTGDIQIAAILDRTILAVAEVILRCKQRTKDIESLKGLIDG